MNRTKSSLINFTTALIGQGLSLVVSFFARIVFIRCLGIEYLGINGLFANILAVLSLAELGIGPAIIFSLYQPLAENNERQIKALMKFYQKAYILIGCTIALLGLMMLPFIEIFVHEISALPNLQFIFLLFLINSVISYFYSYKRSLIVADQRRYIVTIYRYAFFVVLNIVQIIFLLFTKNYILFLVLQILFTLLENVSVSLHADRLYPFLKIREHIALSKETLQQIIRNSSAMILHKIGGIVVNSTDNILISVFVGTIWVGLYSNYVIIITACNAISSQFFTAITASVGNLSASVSRSRTYKVFGVSQFINFWIYGWVSIALMQMLNPFIGLWLGKDLLLAEEVVFFIIINFYISGMRKSTLTFKDALGLYWYDRYKPIFEVIINLSVSIILAQRFGLSGIFMGTLVSSITTCFWVEPYIVYRYGFQVSVQEYFQRYGIYTAAVVLAGFVTGWFCHFIIGNTMICFVLKLFICLFIPNLLFFLLFHKTKEFQQILQIIYRVF